jgi:type IV fimbrial biogenesis protein FimT
MDVGKSMPRANRGLTLVELVTTLAVISISLALIVPGWAAVTERSRVTSSANHLLTMLRYARNEAIFRQAVVTLCPSIDAASCTGDPNDWNQGYLVFLDNNRNRKRESNEPVLRQTDASVAGLELRSTASRPAIRFFPDGAAWGTNTTFSVCLGNPATNRAVILHGAGRARVDSRKPDGKPVTCT